MDGGYEEAVFENLVYRYEEPNGMTRWDSPLFTVVYDDPEPPFEQIWEAIMGSEGAGKTVKANLATVKVCVLFQTLKRVPLTWSDCRRNQQPNLIIFMSSTK